MDDTMQDAVEILNAQAEMYSSAGNSFLRGREWDKAQQSFEKAQIVRESINLLHARMSTDADERWNKLLAKLYEPLTGGDAVLDDMEDFDFHGPVQ